MEKIAITELVDFRERSDRAKKNLAYKLKHRKAKEKNNVGKAGGDYWVTSTSCIRNVFKTNDKQLYTSKIEELHAKLEDAENKRTKSMYQRNIDILTRFNDFDLTDLKPSSDIRFEKIPTSYKVIVVDKFPLYVNPSIVYSFKRKGKAELGALWLVSKITGFDKTELGMFNEMLYKFLINNFADNYQISEDYCCVVDTFNARSLTYKELLDHNIPFLIEATLKEISGS